MKSKVSYWVVTGLFALPMVLGGVVEIASGHKAVALMKGLGYPAYLLAFLGVAKLLGVAAILLGRSSRLREWAYAGFTFDLLGAVYSHLAMGQTKEAFAPLMICLVGVASYTLWRRQAGQESGSAPESRDRSTLRMASGQ